MTPPLPPRDSSVNVAEHAKHNVWVSLNSPLRGLFERPVKDRLTLRFFVFKTLDFGKHGNFGAACS